MNKTMLATLTLGAAIAFSGTAFAEKMKATLDGKAEVPPNASTGTGTADIDYDPATKKLSWKVTYSGLSGPATAAHFHGPADVGKNGGVAVAIPNAGTSPAEGSATLTDAGGRPRGRQVLCQRSHRGQSRRRTPRPGDEVTPCRDVTKGWSPRGVHPSLSERLSDYLNVPALRRILAPSYFSLTR